MNQDNSPPTIRTTLTHKAPCRKVERQLVRPLAEKKRCSFNCFTQRNLASVLKATFHSVKVNFNQCLPTDSKTDYWHNQGRPSLSGCDNLNSVRDVMSTICGHFKPACHLQSVGWLGKNWLLSVPAQFDLEIQQLAS